MPSHCLSPARGWAVPVPRQHPQEPRSCSPSCSNVGLIHPRECRQLRGAGGDGSTGFCIFLISFFLKGLYNLGDSINKNNGFELWEQPAPAMSKEMLQVQNTAVWR